MAKTLHRALRRTGLVAFAAVTLLAATACYNNNTGQTNIGGDIQFTLPAFPESGGHAVEVFTEMHFQPSYRVQEGRRILPPPDSVPVTGKELRYGSLEEYQALEMPSDFVETYDRAAAQRLYDVNCLVCHGEGLQGDGKIRDFIKEGTRGPFPANLTTDVTTSSSDGELFGFITGGGRQGLAFVLAGRESRSPMPPYGLLLTEEDRWHLVQYLRDRTGR